MPQALDSMVPTRNSKELRPNLPQRVCVALMHMASSINPGPGPHLLAGAPRLSATQRSNRVLGFRHRSESYSRAMRAKAETLVTEVALRGFGGINYSNIRVSLKAMKLNFWYDTGINKM